jgi:hypothetical protein
MNKQIFSIFSLLVAVACPQDPPVKGEIRQFFDEVKTTMAENQARLRQYTWTETVEISLKGEVKKRLQNSCRYGPNGQIQKIPIGAPSPPPSGGRIKRRIVTDKTEDLKDYMEGVSSLLRRYIPPDPQALQAAFAAGKAMIEPASGTLVFNDYIKPGDKFSITFDRATKKLVGFAVATYIDEPKDGVSVNSRFSALADGTSFIEQSTLDANAKKLQIVTTNFGYQKVSN